MLCDSSRIDREHCFVLAQRFEEKLKASDYTISVVVKGKSPLEFNGCTTERKNMEGSGRG